MTVHCLFIQYSEMWTEVLIEICKGGGGCRRQDRKRKDVS